MKKLTKVERLILSSSDGQYDSYRCEEHGIYQVKSSLPEDEHRCLYCMCKHEKLSKQEIEHLINS